MLGARRPPVRRQRLESLFEMTCPLPRSIVLDGPLLSAQPIISVRFEEDAPLLSAAGHGPEARR